MVKIVGKEIVKYFSKKNQRDVEGFRVHVIDQTANPKVEGFKCDSFFVSTDTFVNYFDLPLGTEIEVYYNRYGNPSGCTVVTRKE